ncbi:ADP-ribosylglycohydrolase family protein [Microbacterium koreense]|uniref:ADP-ribosylglycohydrolase family protein n=1 Tax=Microbacterium koreense TaxID=323761 RepID=A0ABW2ZRV8_9MICO
MTTDDCPIRSSLSPSDSQVDRAIGAVVGMAAGDALGSQYEFGPALADHIVPEFGVGVFGHEAGEWTDDTTMAMPILDALAQRAGLAARNGAVASSDCEDGSSPTRGKP